MTGFKHRKMYLFLIIVSLSNRLYRLPVNFMFLLLYPVAYLLHKYIHKDTLIQSINQPINYSFTYYLISFISLIDYLSHIHKHIFSLSFSLSLSHQHTPSHIIQPPLRDLRGGHTAWAAVPGVWW